MKQKTLFESFPLQNFPKMASSQLSEGRDLSQSGTTVKSAGHNRNGSSLSNIIDLTKAKSPSPLIEIIKDSKCPVIRYSSYSRKTSRDCSRGEGNHQRGTYYPINNHRG
jgi:hypothetical protein